MYSPKTLEVTLLLSRHTVRFKLFMQSERASWRTVVYFNIVRSLKHILSTLAAYDDMDDDSDANSHLEFGDDDTFILGEGSSSKRTRSGKSTAFTNAPSSSKLPSNNHKLRRSPSQIPLPKSPKLQPSAHQIANLRLRLSPLLSTEESLAKRLNGGVTTGRGEVFVRSGWQVRTFENGGLVKARRSKRSNTGHGHGPSSVSASGLPPGLMLDEDPLLDDLSALVEGSKEDIKDLWDDPTVVALITKRKLKLDEWSE
jgi:guanine nucleotide-binding protein alpha-1 subunit